MLMSNQETNSKNQIESKYMELSSIHLEPIVLKISQNNEHVLIDMYRKYLEETLNNITNLDEELKIIKQYFGNRFIIVKEDVSKLVTYPDNYKYDFDGNVSDLCKNFINKHNNKDSKITTKYNYYKNNNRATTFGFQSFSSRYLPYKTTHHNETYRIPKTSLEHYKELFKKYVVQEIIKDRNRYRFIINYIYEPGKYPDKSPGIFFDNTKNLLTAEQIQILEEKINRLLKIRKGKSVLYHIESFTSTYLSEIYLNQFNNNYQFDKLQKYNKVVEYPTLQTTESSEQFIGNIYDIIKQLPRGTKVINVETILRQDLIWRFLKFQTLMKEKYPNKPSNYKIDIGYHGTKEDRLHTIISDGLMIPREDNGLSHLTCGARYGNGIYLSPDPRFSMHYCRGDSCLLVCAVIPGRKYVCTTNIWNGQLVNGYDSHISTDKTELVLFDEAQVLPCVIIHFNITEMYQDWWDVYYNGTKKKLTYREKMNRMNKKEKKEYLKSFASYLPYGFGNGNRFEVEDVIFPDEIDDYEADVEWHGTIDNSHYNKYQKNRF